MSIRTCAWCAGPLAPGARRDAITCSKACRQARNRAAQYLRLSADVRPDALAHGIAPMTTLPSRVVGLKPPAFCRWMFDLIGATPTDTLDDLFPGSGIVGRCWDLFAAAADDGSAALDEVAG